MRAQRNTDASISSREPDGQALAELPEKLFEALRAMDREASVIHGGPTGLCWYGARKTRQTSRHWIPRLTVLLNEGGFEARGQQPYPSGSARCDLAIRVNGNESCWIEIVGAWKDYCRRVGMESIYRATMQYPIESSQPLARKHKLAIDIERLSHLSQPHAHYIGVLIVGFDSTTFPMDEDIRDLKARSELGRPPWRVFENSWVDPHRDGCSVKCWLFLRPT